MQNRLEQLISNYIENKKQLDQLDALVKRENSEIKKLMEEQSLTSYIVDDQVLSYQVQNRESWDEEKLITVLKENKIKGIIKKKEYVDAEALESAIYKNKLSSDVLSNIMECQNIKEIITLRIRKVKTND